MYHVAAYFDVLPGREKDFIAAALADGRGSLAGEKGTLRFEVVQDDRIVTRFWLNEAYVDRETFERDHKGGVHFKTFMALISEYATFPKEPIIAGSTITDEP